MTVAGYNVQPDVNDLEPCTGVEYTEGEHTATLFIDQEDIKLTADEMRVLRGRLLTAIEKIEWLEATWVYARTSIGTVSHLMRKGEHGEDTTTVCGQKPPQYFTWSLDPVIKHPGDWHMCKKCMKIYEKEQVNA